MKIIHFSLALLISFTLFTSCAKKETKTAEPTEDLSTAEDNIRGISDDNSLFNIIDSESEVQPGVKKTDGNGAMGYFLEGASSQPVITLDTVSVAGHRLLTIDFGETGIYCPKDNRTRKGKVKCDIIGRYRANGSSCLASFENYRVSGGNQVGQSDSKFATRSGTVNLAYEKNTATNNNWVYTETITDAKITYPDGKTITWNGTRKRTWYKTVDSNSSVNDFSNDYWTIENNLTGKDQNGVSYTEVTDSSDPLRFEPARCTKFFYSGKTVIKINGKADRVVDYGKNADCDKVVITINGKDYTVSLL